MGVVWSLWLLAVLFGDEVRVLVRVPLKCPMLSGVFAFFPYLSMHPSNIMRLPRWRLNLLLRLPRNLRSAFARSGVDFVAAQVGGPWQAQRLPKFKDRLRQAQIAWQAHRFRKAKAR